jgi:hypothetical protein
MAEIPRVMAFDTLEFEDGDWDGPDRDDDVLSYKSKTAAASLKITRGGVTVFDKDFPKGKEIRCAGNVVHLPEGVGPEV